MFDPYIVIYNKDAVITLNSSTVHFYSGFKAAKFEAYDRMLGCSGNTVLHKSQVLQCIKRCKLSWDIRIGEVVIRNAAILKIYNEYRAASDQ